jgi:hypothetical protein
MKFGVSIFNTDYSMRIDELARILEARGFGLSRSAPRLPQSGRNIA